MDDRDTYYEPELDFSLIHSEPHKLYIGELPMTYNNFFVPVIFNFCRSLPYTAHGLNRIVFCFPFDDLEDNNLIPSASSIVDFLTIAHQYAEHQDSYWHCMAGINRSSFMAAAYLTMYRDMHIEDAVKLIRSKRSDICLNNKIFENYLYRWLG